MPDQDGRVYAGKTQRFNSEGVPLCPNDCGLMTFEVLPEHLLVTEARGRCPKCRHTMIFALEQAAYLNQHGVVGYHRGYGM